MDLRFGSQITAVERITAIRMLNFMLMVILYQFMAHGIAIVVAIIICTIITVGLTRALPIPTIGVMLVITILREGFTASIAHFRKRRNRDGN